jgi:hypothetical protein
MSSIAYITDKQMIEYHRLNGNSTINFWRPSSSKRFTNFNPGDLLFFLAKGTENWLGEKGLVGYGRYTKLGQYSFNQMWQQYSTLNGYEDMASFKEAMLKMTKNKQIRGRYSCLELTDIVFFQAPVYLSEFGLKISKTIESYIYLDKDDPDMTSKILIKANEIGVDAWSSAVSRYAPASSVFEDDLNRHMLHLALNSLPNKANEKDKRRQTNLLKYYVQKHHLNAQWIDDRQQELCLIDNEGIRIITAVSCLKQHTKERLIYEIGKKYAVESSVTQIGGFCYTNLKYLVLVEEELNKDIQVLLELNDIETYVIVLPSKDASKSAQTL